MKGIRESTGLYIVAPFVQAHSTKQPLLRNCLLMLVIMVVTMRDFQFEGHAVGKS